MPLLSTSTLKCFELLLLLIIIIIIIIISISIAAKNLYLNLDQINRLSFLLLRLFVFVLVFMVSFCIFADSVTDPRLLNSARKSTRMIIIIIIITIIIIIIITLFVSLYALMCFPPILAFN
jgi:hypothetical protein